MAEIWAVFETDEEVYGTDEPQIHTEHIYATEDAAQRALQSLAQEAADAYGVPCCENVGFHWSHGTTHLNVLRLEVKS